VFERTSGIDADTARELMDPRLSAMLKKIDQLIVRAAVKQVSSVSVEVPRAFWDSVRQAYSIRSFVVSGHGAGTMNISW
jgi:hypothetical protein